MLWKQLLSSSISFTVSPHSLPSPPPPRHNLSFPPTRVVFPSLKPYLAACVGNPTVPRLPFPPVLLANKGKLATSRHYFSPRASSVTPLFPIFTTVPATSNHWRRPWPRIWLGVKGGRGGSEGSWREQLVSGDTETALQQPSSPTAKAKRSLT